MENTNFLIGTLSTGGAERTVSNLTINMDKKIEKKTILFGAASKIDYPYEGEIIYLDKSNHSNLLVKLKLIFARTFKIRKLKKDNPNIPLISFLEYPNLINALTSKCGRSIVSVRNHMSMKHNKGIKSKFWNFTIKYLYSRTDLIIAVSEEIRKDLIENYKISSNIIKVIYNSYDIKGIRELAKERIEEREIFDKPVIITAGRLNKQKGQWHLIRAFKKVKDYIKDAKLVILGEGELEPYLKDIAKELKIDQDVHFLGFQENPFKYVSRSKLFVLPSFHEGFPNALAEAMACGIPVVSSDCLSGPREILAPNEFNIKNIDYEIRKDRFGVLLPICDGKRYGANDPITVEEHKMADAIRELLINNEMREYFSKQSFKRIQDFEITNIIREWESII